MCPIRSRELWSITDLRFNLEIFVFSAVIFGSSISSEIPIERLRSHLQSQENFVASDPLKMSVTNITTVVS